VPASAAAAHHRAVCIQKIQKPQGPLFHYRRPGAVLIWWRSSPMAENRQSLFKRKKVTRRTSRNGVANGKIQPVTQVGISPEVRVKLWRFR